jgi:hypothetical protein
MCNVFDPHEGDVTELEALCPQQGLDIGGFLEDGSHLHGLLKSFFAASNKNLFQGGYPFSKLHLAQPNEQAHRRR